MKLSAIKLQNHGRIQDCDVEVRDHLVLVGPNDVGKSSLLRCLDLVLGSTTAQLYSRITAEDFRDPAVPFSIEVTLGDLSRDEEALFPDEVSIEPNSSTRTLTIRLEATADESGTVQVSRTAPSGRTGRQLSRDQLAGLGWKMISAVQSSVRDFRQERNSSLDDILSHIDLGDEQGSFEEIARQFQGRLTDSAVLKQLRERLASQLSRAVPEKLGTDDLSFISGTEATQDLLSDVRLQVTRQGQPRNMTQQSDGARALFAIALYDLVSASANVVAIDEPEIHLHPTSQRSLARLLRDGQNQKIIATHSPDIVGAFQPENIVSVRPGGRLVQPAAGFLSAQHRLVAHWWVRDRLEPLTAAKVVLVEGVSDRIIIQRIAELVGYELDRLSVSLVELDGAGGVGYVLSLFGDGGFRIPLSFVIDEDAVAATAAKLGVAESVLGTKSVYVCQRDLEDEYVRALGFEAVWNAIVASGLFTRNELANCTSTGNNGAYTHDDVAGFCRSKSTYKVRAAIVVAGLLDNESAAKIRPVLELLQALAAVTSV